MRYIRDETVPLGRLRQVNRRTEPPLFAKADERVSGVAASAAVALYGQGGNIWRTFLKGSNPQASRGTDGPERDADGSTDSGQSAEATSIMTEMAPTNTELVPKREQNTGSEQRVSRTLESEVGRKRAAEWLDAPPDARKTGVLGVNTVTVSPESVLLNEDGSVNLVPEIDLELFHHSLSVRRAYRIPADSRALPDAVEDGETLFESPDNDVEVTPPSTDGATEGPTAPGGPDSWTDPGDGSEELYYDVRRAVRESIERYRIRLATDPVDIFFGGARVESGTTRPGGESAEERTENYLRRQSSLRLTPPTNAGAGADVTEIFRLVVPPGESYSRRDLPADLRGSDDLHELVADTVTANRTPESYTVVFGTFSLLEDAVTAAAATPGTPMNGIARSLRPGERLAVEFDYTLSDQHTAVAESSAAFSPRQVATAVDLYNESGASRHVLVAPYRGDTVRARITDGDDPEPDVWSFQLRKGEIVRFEPGDGLPATTVVEADWETVHTVLRSDEPMDTLLDAMGDRVRIRGTTPTSTIKNGTVSIGIGLTRTIRGIQRGVGETTRRVGSLFG
jgi:hypothetical protein